MMPTSRPFLSLAATHSRLLAKHQKTSQKNLTDSTTSYILSINFILTSKIELKYN